MESTAETNAPNEIHLSNETGKLFHGNLDPQICASSQGGLRNQGLLEKDL